MTTETSGGLLDLLGLDPEDLEWQDLALCAGMETNLWFDEYEADEFVARTTDEACLSCPVMKQCLEFGIDNGESGVWGGVYLTSGRQDKNRNSHKSRDVWDAIREKISE